MQNFISFALCLVVVKACPLEFGGKLIHLVFHESNKGGYDEGDAGRAGLGVEVGRELVTERLSRANWLDY